ncbi:microtubule cross-linking factor 1 isoform X2 [Denticeps clupeoides]|uniref:DUF4482 domain-containing protein n=1 Tax=Denticeps clupeoides TaxID=299321 RepID=A0AAY4BY30_9TELE|nr:microtubule cross-linking factor 1 isoform X2 [Denticeps clupeoides]
MMESPNGSGSDVKAPSHQQEKKRLNRAPSPARPLLKDVHSRTPKPPATVPRSPKLNKQQQPPPTAAQSRLSRRTLAGAKEKPAPVRSTARPAAAKKAVKVTQHAASAEQRPAGKAPEGSPHHARSKKAKLAPLALGAPGHGSPVRVPGAAPAARVSQTDSSSDLSDCPSEPLSDEQRLAQAANSDAESGAGSGSSERGHPPQAAPLPAAAAARSPRSVEAAEAAPLPAAKGMSPGTGSGRVEGGKELIQEDLLREIEELHSENDYLKDELDELRAEMEEVRDSYLEEEMYQLQELRRDLDRSNKNCRILQYRLRKAEQRGLRAAQTGHVDGELLRGLEQDLKVAKDVSVRLHNELESVEDKRTRAEDENEMLRQKIIEVEVSKEALHNELEKAKETAIRRRGSRESFKDKKSLTQEDSADLRCQLQFAKEESTLMRKKMAKLGREKDELEQELQKYKSVYGDIDSPLPMAEVVGGGPHSTREAELRLRLKLVEEEANILGRKIVELEVENRGLRAENEDLRCQYERDCFGREPFSSVPTSPYGADALESASELRRHLQFVEEEAELLRRSISEIEDHNKQLTSELNRFKFGPSHGDGEEAARVEGGGNGGGASAPQRPMSGNGNGVGVGSSGASVGGLLQEELKAARLQINELSGKVMKLQYENRVLISNMQRCDLALHLGVRTGSPRDTDSDADAGRRLETATAEEEEEEEARRALLLQHKREGPVGGESDSEDLFEKTATSGFGSGKPSEMAESMSVELAAQRRRVEDREMLNNMKREAERLGKMVDRLILDTDSLIYEGRLLVTGAEAVITEGAGALRDEDSSHFSVDAKPDSKVLDAINTRMKAFRSELHIFMEKVDHLGDGLRERGDDLSPLPNLTESSSFLSTITSMSRDSPIGTLGRDLITDFQSGQREEPQWCLGQEGGWRESGAPGPLSRRASPGHARGGRPQGLRVETRDPSVSEVSTPAREVQFRLDHERRLRSGQEDREGFQGSVAQEEEQRRLEARRGLELQGLQPLDAPWPQERALMQQELRLFRHNTIILYMKLRWILMHWRLGRRMESGEEGAHDECERLESVPELGVVTEQVEGKVEDTPVLHVTEGDITDAGAMLPSPDCFHQQKQLGDNRHVLQALRSLLKEFACELREEEQRRCQLQQAYASERATWEVQRSEMRRRIAQLEEVRGEAAGSADMAEIDLFGQEREEQRRLLEESHSTALELRWKLHHGEKRWSRERAELLERLNRERQEWDWGMREMQRKMERMQRELDGKDCGVRRVFSPQDSPGKAPRSPRSLRSSCPAPVLPARSHSDSEATLEERGALSRLKPNEGLGPGESLFIDALSLDPLSEAEVPPPSKLETEKRFPCLKEALDEISERAETALYPEEEMTSGSLLRAKSVCSMSDFQRLMDSSPFLPDKGRPSERGRDTDVTPPLSPDDLKYIEEFNSKGWEFANALSASCPIPGPFSLPGQTTQHLPPPPTEPMEAWGERLEARRVDPSTEAFQASSWYLTTSATITTNTLSSPNHCQHLTQRSPGQSPGPSHVPPEHFGIHVLHSPTRGPDKLASGPGASEQPEYQFSKGGKIGGEGGAGDMFGGGRWPCTSGPPILRPGECASVCSAVGYTSSLELNLSDDMKEVAFSVRNAIRHSPGPPERAQLRDMACQTNGFTTRGTQTTQTISVGLQTEGLRTLTSSPHRCLTPKGGGSTPISSPSRSLRKMQYSPVVQTKFERPCCSPKYGSPKLQRKLSNAGKADVAPGGAGAGGTGGPSRIPTPTSTPQKGNNESAWARSTTTRDSPVHTTINDGLSSLFNIIDHTPLAYDAIPKYNRSPIRSRSNQVTEAGTDPKSPAHPGTMQELLRGNNRGRSPSPVQLIVETQGEKSSEVISIRQDLSAPPGYTLAENTARILNKKLLEQGLRDDRRYQSTTPIQAPYSKDGRSTEGEKSGCMEDLPRFPVAPPLEACFQRPARPANRRPPSRWAAHSPSSSPTWKESGGLRFRFPSPIRPTQTIPELEEPILDHQLA